MIKNYLLIAFRNFHRNSFYSIINVSGLAIGIACSMLIALWVADEMSFDRFHTNHDNIYKIYMTAQYNGELGSHPNVPYPVMEAAKSKSSAIKRAAMTNHSEGYILAVGDRKVTKMAYAATEDFFKLFSFQFLKGDPNKALNDQRSVVIDESTAKALFGDQDPIGQTVLIDSDDELKVSAVIKDVPAQSTFQFNFIIPFSYWEAKEEWVRETKENWKNSVNHIYIELEPSASAEDVAAAIKDLVRDNEPGSPTAELFLHPMNKWRLQSSFKNGKYSGGMIVYVRLFTAIAVFILAIACINFMNLATARSEKRAREVGIRKSVGSRRSQLIAQFLGESILITTIGFVIALVIVELTIPLYNTLVGKQLTIEYSNPVLWLGALSVVTVTGVIAGSYPAFYLSAFQPVKVLKGKLVTSGGASMPRKVLVTLQFGFSIFLIIGTMVIYQQIMHVKGREVGYDRENLLLVWSNSEAQANYKTIKEELKRTGVVKSVSKSSAPITRIFSSTEVTWQGKDPNQKIGFVTVATEYDYIQSMGMKLVEGRDFSPEFPSDSSAVIINQAAVDIMGLKDPIGGKLTMWGDEWNIIGVTENVIMGSPYVSVDPSLMAFNPSWSSTINIRLEKTEDISSAVSKVEDVFKKLNPSFPISYRFADVEFETKFSSINLISRLAGIFASLAIFITCLGLFGLAAFTAEQRRKELGIRKVLGATVGGLILLMSKEFSRLVLIGFAIASPIAWWAVEGFLEEYQYRISIAWWIIPLAGASSLLLAMIIVCTQAFRAAQANPVDSLRSE